MSTYSNDKIDKRGCPGNCPYSCKDCYPYTGPEYDEKGNYVVIGKPNRLAKKIKELKQEIKRLEKENEDLLRFAKLAPKLPKL